MLNQNIDVKLGERVLKYESVTRTIARPNGWIFVIPLTNRTSYGYIYNSSINSVSEIEADFDKFLISEGITCVGSQRHLYFPNFTQRTFFDGSVLKLGNAALFLEPLEATAIGCILNQIVTFSYWPLGHFSKLEKRERLNENDLRIFNRYLLNYVCEVSLFVGWHYAMGSGFDTEFWQFAQSNFNKEIKKLENKNILEEFEKNLQSGAKFIHPIKNYMKFSKRIVELTKASEKLWSFPQLRGAAPKIFGMWRQHSFAEIGYGIGYFS